MLWSSLFIPTRLRVVSVVLSATLLLSSVPQQSVASNTKQVGIIATAFLLITGVIGLALHRMHSQFQTTEMPTIKYNMVVSPKTGNKHLIPSINYNDVKEITGSEEQLNDIKSHHICSPILDVMGLAESDIIYSKCIKRFQSGFPLPHTYTASMLNESSKVVLPELVYNPSDETLAFLVSSAVFTGKKPPLSHFDPSSQFIFIHTSVVNLDSHFRTCHLTREMPSMNPPKTDSRGHLYFEIMNNGVSLLHHDHEAFFIVATNINNKLSLAYWVADAEWPTTVAYMEGERAEEILSDVSTEHH